MYAILAFLSAKGLTQFKKLSESFQISVKAKSKCLKKKSEKYVTRPVLGSKLGSKFSLGGHCVSALRLAKVLGNLAQAKTGSTQDPICIEKFCNEFEFVPFVTTTVTV